MPIYYESRLAKLDLDEAERPKIDLAFEEVTEGEEVERKERLKTKWAQLEALDGKAMVVCMSRHICVELYNEIVRLRPKWHHDDYEKGVIKVVMTGSASDPPEWQLHIRNNARRERLAERFRDPNDPLRS